MTPNGSKKTSEKALLRELHFEYRMIKERNKYEKIKIDREIDDCKLQISAYSMKGKRCHMEDFYDIGYLMKPKDQQRPNEWPYEYFYFGVFDGHGGKEAASFAKKNLLKAITTQANFWSDDDEDVQDAIKRGFAETHAAMREDMPNWARTKWHLPSTAGTTASVLFIKNGKFYTGHVGDSRIVISKKHPETESWLNEDLTVDQKPENEIKRIEAAGGEVKNKIGVHRVVWNRPIFTKATEARLRDTDPNSTEYQYWSELTSTYPIKEHLVSGYQTIPFLAIARSLGDFWSINQNTEEYMVSPEPDVSCRPIDKNDKCILLATDGLWNVMSSALAVRLLQELKVVKKDERNNEQHSNKYFATDNFYDFSIANYESNHALSLVYMAYQMWERRRLRSDNITAVVAMLGDLLETCSNKSENQPVATEEAITSPAKSTAFGIDYILENTKQIGSTRLFFQNISTTKKADFESYHDTFFECELLGNLEHFLVFPPTVFGDVLPYVIPPRNYVRLAEAKTRKLERDEADSEQQSDSYIYIKEVSDDPEDAFSLPTRFNKRGKEVRDSSAQATQAMHDFGQPWDQLTNDQPSLKKAIIPRRYTMRVATGSNKNDPDDILYEDDDDDNDDVDSDEDYELVFEGELKDGDVVIMEDRSDEEDLDDEDDCYTVNESDEEEDDSDDDDNAEPPAVLKIAAKSSLLVPGDDSAAWPEKDLGNRNVIGTRAAKKGAHKSTSEARSDDESDTDLTIEQVLSVVSENKTPVTRRSTRRSATENPKRKREIPLEPSPKSKRRRSHPVQTAVPARA